MREKSLSSWAEDGVGVPNNVYSGFGNATPDTFEVRLAAETSENVADNGFEYVQAITSKVDTEILLPDSLDGMSISVNTGMPLIGWSFSYSDYDVMSYELMPGEKFKITYPGVVTLFPCFDGYYVEASTHDLVSQSVRISGSKKQDFKISIPATIDEQLIPGVDVSKCVIVYDVDIVAKTVFTYKGSIPNRQGLVSFEIEDVGGVTNDNGRLDGVERVPIHMVANNLFANTDTSTIDLALKLKTDANNYNVDVVFDSYISAWTLYPKKVYNPPQPDEHPSGW